MSYRGRDQGSAMQSCGRDRAHVVQSPDVRNQAVQFGWHRRIGSVPEIGSVRDNLGREGRLGGCDAALDRDGSGALIDFDDKETCIREPLFYRLDLRRGRAEALVEFRSAQPVMVFGRVWILLRGQQLLQRGLIVQAQHDAEFERCAALGTHRSKIGDIRGMVSVNF
jgi:hypothetical protein